MKTTPATKRHRKPTEFSADFERFWAAYPKKTGKGGAARAFENAVKKSGHWPGIEEVLKALNAAKSSDQWAKCGGQYIPMAQTWLNQMRWLDDAASLNAPDDYY